MNSNREIKFRQWLKGVPEPVYWGFFKAEDGSHWNGPCTQMALVIATEQSTGMKDSEGVDVYEGDLVYSDQWNPSKYEVVFDRGAFCLKFEDDAAYYPDIKYVEGMKVIGNIHQNSELLP
jgi:hypothetical protein